MNVLLDTNIVIHREAQAVALGDIGLMFRWLDNLGYRKYVHPGSIDEIRRHADKSVVKAFEVKLGNYNVLATLAPQSAEIKAIHAADRTDNDRHDTLLLAELDAGRVKAIITEDRGIHRKANALGLGHAVFTVESFLQKIATENPELTDYKVLEVRKRYFGEIDIRDQFFDSLRDDYPGFDAWFGRKSQEYAYVCEIDRRVAAFLYIKKEGAGESYHDISPPLRPATRLKIGTFKVVAHGLNLGERFLKVVFDNALRLKADEIYVTLRRRTEDQDRLARFLEDWGFFKWGVKTGAGLGEDVLVRDFRPRVDLADPQKTFPFIARESRKWVVPIWPAYHTELFPDSILTTEEPRSYELSRPNRNALRKVYVSRSFERGLLAGDAVVFYRTRDTGRHAHYSSVITTLGVVESVVPKINSLAELIRLCRKRSVFSDAELRTIWNQRPQMRPFVINFLYMGRFGRYLNLAALKGLGILKEAPRGFERLSDSAFELLMEKAHGNDRLVVG